MSLKLDPVRKVYVARWYEGGRGSRYRQKSLGADAAKAKAAYKKILGDAERSRENDETPERITFAELAAAYLEAKKRKMTPAGYERSKSIIDRHLVPAFGSRQVTAFRAADIETYLSSRVTDGASPATANREWNTIRAIFRYGDRKRHIPERVTKHVEPFRIEGGGARRDFFSPDEWARFMAAFENESAWHAHIDNTRKLGEVVGGQVMTGKRKGQPQKPRRFGGGRKAWSPDARKRFARFREMQPVFELLLGLGGRIGEVVAQQHASGKWSGLLWRDVDHRGGLLSLRQGKTGKTVVIPLTDDLRAALHRFPRGIGETPVCRDSSGTPFYIAEVQRAFAVARKIAGINANLTPHALRHTLGSWLASAGESLRTIQELLGHSSPVVTAKHYAHLLPADEAKVRAVTRISEIAAAARRRGAISVRQTVNVSSTSDLQDNKAESG